MTRYIFALLFSGICIFPGCSKSGSDSKPDPNGNWKVTVITGGHCLAPASSKIIAVTNGQFSDVIATYSGHTLSIAGTITMGNIKFAVSGNETIAGSGCNGTNGFFDYIDPSTSPIAGNVTSNWGSLRFEKQ